MKNKVGIVIAAFATFLAIGLIAVLVVPIFTQRENKTEGIAEIKAPAVSDTPVAATTASTEAAPAPVFDRDKALTLVKGMTDGKVYSPAAWDKLVEDAKKVGMTIDESCKKPYDEYGTAGNNKQTFLVLGSTNVGSQWERVSEKPDVYKVNTSLKRAQANTSEVGDVAASETAKVVSALQDTNDSQYYTNVTFRVEVSSDGKSARLFCENPDWYKA